MHSMFIDIICHQSTSPPKADSTVPTLCVLEATVAYATLICTFYYYYYSCLRKIPGLSRIPKTFFQVSVIAQQC